MTATAARPDGNQSVTEILDLTNLFPADPDLMVSPEGDRRGLQKLKDVAQRRLDAQAAS